MQLQTAKRHLSAFVSRFPWMANFGEFNDISAPADNTTIRLTEVERSLNAMAYEIRDLLRHTKSILLLMIIRWRQEDARDVRPTVLRTSGSFGLE
jgi:hypothetical protein